MKRTAKMLLALAFILIASGCFFFENDFAYERSNRYRPLANGWISYHAGIFIKNEGSFLEKTKKSVESDLVHGRFRPAFTWYATLPYALSPLAHDRSSTAEGRPFERLANGDLRLFALILLGSAAASMAILSLLGYVLAGEVAFFLIPALFVPLSPSMTENLQQNFIDSQELPLVFWMSAWLFFFFLALRMNRSWLRTGCLAVAMVFLIMSFLAKETAVVVSVALLAVAIPVWFLGSRKNSAALPLAVASAVSMACSAAVYLIVSMNHKGYAASYSALNPADLQAALIRLWGDFSKHSLNNWHGWLPLLAFGVLAVKERKNSLGGIPMSTHASLVALLLLLSCGFLLILAPWRPILIKYVFPSVFFFSCAVAASLAFMTAWSKERFGKRGNLLYLALLPYVFHFNAIHADARWARNYCADSADYGAAAADGLADSIAQELKRSPKESLSVFVEYGTRVSWANPVPWGKLHLMRILNLDKKVNLADAKGRKILNYEMPEAELSSFRDHAGSKMLHVVNEGSELRKRRFDVVYKGYGATEEPAPELAAGSAGVCYRATEERIVWQSRTGSFPGFFFCKYVPSECRGAKTAAGI